VYLILSRIMFSVLNFPMFSQSKRVKPREYGFKSRKTLFCSSLHLWPRFHGKPFVWVQRYWFCRSKKHKLTAENLFNIIQNQFSSYKNWFYSYYLSSRKDLPSFDLPWIFDVMLDAASELLQHYIGHPSNVCN